MHVSSATKNTKKRNLYDVESRWAAKESTTQEKWLQNSLPNNNEMSLQQRRDNIKWKIHEGWHQKLLPQHLDGSSGIHENPNKTNTTINHKWLGLPTTRKERLCICWNHQSNIWTTTGRDTRKWITCKKTWKHVSSPNKTPPRTMKLENPPNKIFASCWRYWYWLHNKDNWYQIKNRAVAGDWNGFCGILLNWNYNGRTVDINVHGYIYLFYTSYSLQNQQTQ